MEMERTVEEEDGGREEEEVGGGRWVWGWGSWEVVFGFRYLTFISWS
jgi:hypothetical protein